MAGGYVTEHSDTHLWYHGMIDLDIPITVDSQEITPAMRSDWWTFMENQGVTAGYYFSRNVGGDRLNDIYAQTSTGYGVAYGGNGIRDLVDSTNAVWPNVYALDIKSNGSSLNNIFLIDNM